MSERLVLTGIDCEHLYQQHGIGNKPVEVGFEGIESKKDVSVGMEGECITGSNGKCPMKHNCGKVEVTRASLPWFVSIEPIKVGYNENTPDSVRNDCTKPPEWFLSLRASLEDMGVTTFDGKLVSDMPYEVEPLGSRVLGNLERRDGDCDIPF